MDDLEFGKNIMILYEEFKKLHGTTIVLQSGRIRISLDEDYHSKFNLINITYESLDINRVIYEVIIYSDIPNVLCYRFSDYKTPASFSYPDFFDHAKENHPDFLEWTIWNLP
jgi:hypothetical protein